MLRYGEAGPQFVCQQVSGESLDQLDDSCPVIEQPFIKLVSFSHPLFHLLSDFLTFAFCDLTFDFLTCPLTPQASPALPPA